jgi:hypothetical protein
MHAKKITLLFIFWLVTLSAFSQTFSYSYTDPCTGAVKTLQVPQNGVTVTYYGQVNTFQPADFYNGGFENWAQGVFGSFGNNNPCASIVGLPAAINVAQNSAINFLGTINSLSALSDMANIGGGSTNMLSGTVQSTQNSTSNGGKKDKGNSKSNSGTNGSTSNGSSSTNSQGTNTNGNSNGSGNGTSQSNNSGSTQTSTGTNNGSNGGSTSSSGTTTSGGQGTSSGSSTNNQGTTSSGNTTSGSSTSGAGNTTSSSSTTGSSTTGSSTTGSSTTGSSTTGSGDPNSGSSTGSGTSSQENPTQTEEGGKTNLVGSSVGSVQNSTSSGSSGNPNNKNGNKPTILASSDFVGFQFKNSDVSTGGKFTGGYASMRWDGARSWGVNMDYTTALRGPNITGYYAFMKPKRIDLISVTGTIGFEAQPTLYGTIAIGQMWTLNKPKNMKAVYMLTGSFGQVYGSPFIGTAAIAGGMYDFKITKRFDFKVLMLYVYAPYVSYYNDILLKSPHVVLPIVGTNINITIRFKLNINTGGAWAIKESALNYTVMFGTRMLL